MGDYYCEHCFFVAQKIAAQSSCIAKDAAGAALVGFLHVPDYGAQPAQRHAATSEVVALAIAGDMRAAMATNHAGPLRLLLTGFGPFEDRFNNPSGDFVADPTRVAVAVARAFAGAKLVSARAVDGARELHFRIKDDAGKTRELIVRAEVLSVTDHMLNVELPSAIATFRPNAVLSMGVNSVLDAMTYTAEARADNGGLVEGAAYAHDAAVKPTKNLVNASLLRAIGNAAAAAKTPLG
jgi:pyrrolidone-carboxylate peptidase